MKVLQVWYLANMVPAPGDHEYLKISIEKQPFISYRYIAITYLTLMGKWCEYESYTR